MQHTIVNIELKELSKTEKFDKITSLVCKINNLTDLSKILEYKDKNRNFLSLEYSNSAVNQKLLTLYKKYRDSTGYVTKMEDYSTTETTRKDTVQYLPDFTLDDLTEIENLGVRAHNICKHYNILTIKELIKFYYENGDFLKVRNCGLKSNEELIAICVKYSNFKFEKTAGLNNKIEENNEAPTKDSFSQFEIDEELSVRSRHICEDNDLNSLEAIVAYYNQNGDFLKLRNCGQKSNEELLGICKKYENLISEDKSFFNDKSRKSIVQKIEKLTPVRKQIVNDFINKQFSELSAQNSNVLYYYFSADISLKGLTTIFEADNFKLINLRNAGKQTIYVFQDFLDKIEAYIELILQMKGGTEQINALLNSLLKSKFILTPSVLSEIGKDYDHSKGLPIFKTIKVLMENNLLFNKRQNEIIKNSFRYFNNTPTKTLDEIASDYNITKERLRQIRKAIFDHFTSSFSFLKQVDLNACNLYEIDIHSDLIIFENTLIAEINKQEHNNFNRLFVNKIFSYLLSGTTELLGNEEKIVLVQSKKLSYYWKSTYLVNRELTECFDFNKFIKDVNYRLSQRRKEDYSLHFETYLEDFKKINKAELSKRIVSCAEKILFDELGIKPDVYKHIYFKRNKKKTVSEYVIEILKEKKTPMTVYEIYDVLKSTAPGITKSAIALKGSCQADKRLVLYGRGNTYGFKEWERNMNIRGGTIRDLVEAYLLKHSGPKHINEIAEFVKKYRNTSAKNILANLKLGKSGRFYIYPKSMIGLISKEKNKT